jgi:hypothetical protein
LISLLTNGPALELLEELLDGVIDNAEAVLDGPDAHSDRQMRLADTRQSEQEHVLGPPDIVASPQELDV